VAHIVEACVEQGIAVIESEEAAEEDWLAVLQRVGAGGARYFQSCTPSFYNSEQQAIDVRATRNLTYSGSLLEYMGYLERWRDEPELAGVNVQRTEATETGSVTR
jgi:cyclohexanone monooxygenase